MIHNIICASLVEVLPNPCVDQDSRFEDVYWQANIEDKYCRTNSSSEHWVLHAVFDTQPGGGAAGSAAVQAAVQAGLHSSRQVKPRGPDGTMVELEEICIRDHTKENAHQ